VCFTSTEFTATRLCSSGRPWNRRLCHNAFTSNRAPSRDWNPQLTSVFDPCASMDDFGDDRRPLSVAQQAGCIWPSMLMRDMTLTLISTQFAAADPVSLPCVATIRSCDCRRYATRRQVWLSVPAIDARGGSQMLVLNALQATHRDITGLSFCCGAWRHTRSSTRLSAIRQLAK
jgi:hypothetical protein